MTIRDLTRLVTAMCVMVFVASTVLAQQGPFQPTQGQSPEQMQRDMADCQAIAKQSTGYDPAQASTQPASAQPQAGGRARGAAKGAVAGAAAAEVKGRQYEGYDKLSDDAKQQYRQKDAKSAAAAGAVVGASQQRQDRRDQRQTQQQQAPQTNTAASAYDQAVKSCMMGRGYSSVP